MTYKPNFTDPRVHKRVKDSIAFVKRYLREDRAQALGTRYIDSIFSSQRRPLGQYLREQLLVCVDERYNKDQKITKKYRLNSLGLAELDQTISSYITQQITYSVAEVANQFQKELSTGIEYKDSSDRKWHWLQHHRREEKAQVLAQSGLVHNYDIQAACPTLLHQYSTQIPEIILDGIWQQGPMDLYLFNLRDYLKNKKTIRQQLAQEADVSVDQIKRLINAMFQGGHISSYRESSSYLLLEGDVARIKFLQQHEFIIGLKQDIKVIWDYIKPALSKRTKEDKNGITRRLPITGRQKTALYRDLERRVRDSVERYLTETNNQYFLEHDGWTTANEIDKICLIEFVRNTSGFEIELDYKCLSI